MRRNLLLSLLVPFLLAPANVATAEVGVYRNPILHEVRIDDDSIQATLIWSTLPTSADDDIDDYAYTIDGKNYVSLFGDYDSSSDSESQTTTVGLPTRANATDSFFAIAKIRDNNVFGVSNMIKGRISERPVPIYLSLVKANEESIIYRIKNFNRDAVSKGYIKYKVNQIRLEQNSSVKISLQDESIYISNYKLGEKISFKTMKYVLACNGFSPYLSCPYNSKAQTQITAPVAFKQAK